MTSSRWNEGNTVEHPIIEWFQTFREAGKVAADNGERLAAEGEICWGGMHSWKAMLETLEAFKRRLFQDWCEHECRRLIIGRCFPKQNKFPVIMQRYVLG